MVLIRFSSKFFKLFLKLCMKTAHTIITGLLTILYRFHTSKSAKDFYSNQSGQLCLQFCLISKANKAFLFHICFLQQHKEHPAILLSIVDYKYFSLDCLKVIANLLMLFVYFYVYRCLFMPTIKYPLQEKNHGKKA